jgi:hypothetical protein
MEKVKPSRRNQLFQSMLCLASLLLSSCASLQRSTQSGYASSYDEPISREERGPSSREIAATEMGLSGDRELSDKESQALQNRMALIKAEKTLEGRREREQYYKNKPYLRSDAECLEFLRLDSYEARARWLNAKGIQSSASAHTPEIQSLVDRNDIALGMTKQAVRDSWGEPDLVEVAGSPLYGNERWHYSEQTSSAEGYHTEQRVVYFESGKVSGWESH